MPTAPDITLDMAPDKIATATQVDACTAEPANHAGISAVSVGQYVTTGADFPVANGDVSGRKVSITAQSGNNGTATGAANYLAFSDGTNLLWVSDGDGDTVNNGSAWSIPAGTVAEFRDPTNS
jgi:hypothetical protein